MTQPDGSKKCIISLLVKEQLPGVSKPWINFTISVDIRRDHPRARHMVEIVDTAFADVDVETDVLLASRKAG